MNPDLYLGEAYTDGSLVIENGSIGDFLELIFITIGKPIFLESLIAELLLDKIDLGIFIPYFSIIFFDSNSE